MMRFTFPEHQMHKPRVIVQALAGYYGASFNRGANSDDDHRHVPPGSDRAHRAGIADMPGVRAYPSVRRWPAQPGQRLRLVLERHPSGVAGEGEV